MLLCYFLIISYAFRTDPRRHHGGVRFSSSDRFHGRHWLDAAVHRAALHLTDHLSRRARSLRRRHGLRR